MKTIYSRIDNTSKHIIDDIEFSFINKNDGKDILCVPSQDGCNLGCIFCHLTGDGKKTRNFTNDWFIDSVYQILNVKERNHDEILFSFMGAGEALLHPSKTIIRMLQLEIMASEFGYTSSRFGVASIIPHLGLIEEFTDHVLENILNVKLHYSLHNPFQKERSDIVPNAANITPSIDALRSYSNDTGNDIEIHYTPITGVNDSKRHANELATITKGIPIKLLKMSDKNGMTGSTEAFAKLMLNESVVVEQYDPPGRDIGSACGQFNQ